MRPAKALAIALIIILAANIILLATRRISALFFWIIIGICAIATYFIKKTRR